MKGKEPYKEGIKYKDRYKNDDVRPRGAPKNGFMSTDFPKRDEYTNTMRTEQLREVLHKEKEMMRLRRQQEEERMKTANVRPQTARPEGGLQRINLYDLVFRMPATNLRMPRDDRQGRAFFMGMRQTQKLQSEGKYEDVKPKIVEGHAWVSVTLPNGEYRQLLVDENRRVLSKRPMSAHI
jgi:hypothetical protein